MHYLRPLFLFLCLLVAPVFVVSAQAEMQDYPIIKLQVLDKSTARTVTLEAKVGTTIEYGSLFIKIQACRKSEPLDPPESSAFIQVWEVPLHAKKSEWVFSGWMFASSPALSAMDHAVYDVWILDCLENKKIKKNKQASKTETKQESADQGELEPAQNTPHKEEGQETKETETHGAETEDVPTPVIEESMAPSVEKSEQPIDNSVESVIESLQNNE